ncbi:MAG: hypothetical protein A3B13_00155 [Candidatus Liptonbacteria bacterium RIFCSPLOWO2_01_FULL_45_15]|uniref:Endonuclease/exonuclease/phosphatase domain-containing protein n=1 Tax=Candidatus Liptonbacteria bacterium RIFCSPLOWO2_01_FULL_45_15 TaxID=1798649 RepID=A0A1G2CIH6_9BACT|nr:MAG: hypothetical protein A3B13_00155 [Candidatus Liptonbacteria bacterium RIFCSPLOWO2_01_FULL_45_15]
MRVKIISWNIWIDGNFDKISVFLRRANADIIGLQEVKNDDPERKIIEFLTGLGYQYVFAPIEKSWSGRKYNDGPAIFSKYPIITSEKYILSETKSRMAVKADIEINNVKLHIFNTHLLHVHQKESDIQNEQVSALIKVLPVDRTIVMGDFNATPESTVIREMKTALIDTDPASSPTWSVYPAGCDECNPQAMDTKLDYIFKTKDIKTDSFEVRKSEGSDHLPISVLVEI